MTHISVGKIAIIGSDNGLSPEQRQAIIWTNAGILLIGPLGTNFSEILIEIQTFSLRKIRLKMSSAKCCSFRLGLNVLNEFVALHHDTMEVWENATVFMYLINRIKHVLYLYYLFSTCSLSSQWKLHGQHIEGWGSLFQIPPFHYVPSFSELWKHLLFIEYHIHIWQVSPQLSCGDTCQLWMWFEEFNKYFCKIKNFPNRNY